MQSGRFLALDSRSRRRHGRVSVAVRAVHSLYRRRHVARRLRHSGLPRARARRLHQYRAGRCLSRRRAAGGGLRDRAAGRCRRARARRRRRTCCGARTSSGAARCPTRRRPARPTTAAISPLISRARRRSPTGPGFKRRLAASKRAGRLRGIGLATYIEACGNNGPDTARVRLDADGGVTVLIGTQSTGQGHATAYAQIIADHLGAAARARARRAGRHRPDRDRRRHRRVELDPRAAARRSTAPRRSSPTTSRQLAADALEAAARRSRTRRWHRARRRHRSRDLVRRSRAAARMRRRSSATERRLRAGGRDLSERHSYRRGRGRSRHRRDRDRQLRGGRRLRRDASIRCCSPARCTAAPCRASARR